MTRQNENILAGIRILIPPARPETNPLMNMIESLGAEVVEFPKLRAKLPSDYGPIESAINELDRFDWIIFSGSSCVENFFERLKALSKDPSSLKDKKIAAIGHGAVKALRKHDIKPDYIPPVHTAKEVTEGFGEISGLKFLLVRIEGAAPSLPQKLSEAGAEVTEVQGYRMIVLADEAETVFSKKFDAVALPNPTAVMFLLKGIKQAGLGMDILKGALIAVVGPATKETAEQAGIIPGIVSEGHIADLRDSLVRYYTDSVNRQ